MDKGKSKSGNSTTRFRRQNFSKRETFLLLQLLKDVQVDRSDQSGNFNPEDWKVIHPLYNEQCKSTTRFEDELRSRYKTVKKSFYVYKELVDKVGWRWNYKENLPVAPSQAAWSELIKANKKYKGYQRRVFPWYKEMEELCGKNASGGNNLEAVNLSDSSNSRHDLNNTPLQDFGQEENNNGDSIGNNQPINIPEIQIELSNGNNSQTEPLATSIKRKRKIQAIENECESSENKSKNTEVTNLFEKIIEQHDRIIKQQGVRNNILSQWVESRPNREDPNKVVREIMSKLNKNGVNLGPNELTALVMTLSNPWIRAVFMNIEGSQVKDWVANMLAPSNLITRRMMTMDMDPGFLTGSSEDEEFFILAMMMDDDEVCVELMNATMLMLSLMS